jgi:Putative Ig domain
MPAGWANWTFWQYTSRGSVPGITTNVDVSYFLLGAVRLLDPGNQQDAPGSTIQLQISSLNAAAGQSPDFTASNLPPGLSINSNGLISGTLSSTASGSYGVTVTAAYPSGGTGSVSFTWTVAITPPTFPPTPSPAPSQSQSPSPSTSPWLIRVLRLFGASTASLTARNPARSLGATSRKFQQAPQPPAHQKIMEDPGFTEVPVHYDPPDLP